MQITIEFEDEDKTPDALNGWKYRSILCELDQWLRSNIKHADKDWQEIRDRLHEEINSEGVSIYD